MKVVGETLGYVYQVRDTRLLSGSLSFDKCRNFMHSRFKMLYSNVSYEIIYGFLKMLYSPDERNTQVKKCFNNSIDRNNISQNAFLGGELETGSRQTFTNVGKIRR